MPVRTEIHEGLVPVKIYTGELEPTARQQLVNISKLPIVHHHVAAMPDVHLGIGATVGSVIPTKKAIIPAAVGVDIGCGMIARRLSLTGNELGESSLRKVFNQISRDVPVGFESHDDRDARTHAAKRFDKGLRRILEKHPGVQKRVGKKASWVHQLGTLGGGNHFIEVCLDEANRAWVMLHSGSRGIGNAIGSYFIELARRDAERAQLALPDRDLAYFVAREHWWFEKFWVFPPEETVTPALARVKFDFWNLPRNQERELGKLLDVFKSIELVSIILRFVKPAAYGIISPPVERVLDVRRGSDALETYRNYLDDLREIQRHYRFARAADADMALWVLHERCFGTLRDAETAAAYAGDRFMLRLRAKNLVGHLLAGRSYAAFADALEASNAPSS